MTNRLREIEALGQAVWIDNINRGLLEDGILQRLVDEDGISGVTSNPTIFEKAMGHSDRYDEGFRRPRREARRSARDLLPAGVHGHPRRRRRAARVYEATEGQDGYISFELPPELALRRRGLRRGGQALLRGDRQGQRPHQGARHGRGRRGVRGADRRGCLGERDAPVRREALRGDRGGLRQRACSAARDAGEPIDRIASVASFFVSRVDGKVDAELDEKGGPRAQGQGRDRQRELAYEEFGRIFSGAGWDALAAKGANVQRPLWASTSTKNPDYPDTLYVDELIGPDTVNTMPDATIDAARDHGTAARTVDKDVAEAHRTIDG